MIDSSVFATTFTTATLVSCHLPWSFSALMAATFSSFVNSFALLLLIFVSSFVSLVFFDLVNGPLSTSLATMLLVAAAIEYFAELAFIDLLAPAFLDLPLERVDLLDVRPLLAVPLGLLVRLDRLVELFVFHPRLLLLEGLDLALLLQQPRLHFRHVLVRLEHLREEVIRTADRDLGLDQNLHAFFHVLTRHVVESDLALDVVMHCQGLWDF